MTGQMATEILLLVIGVWFIAKGTLFGLIYFYPNPTPKLERGELGVALTNMFGSLTLTSYSIGTIFLLRWISGPAPAPRFEPEWCATTLRLSLLLGLVLTTWFGGKVLLAMNERRRQQEALSDGPHLRYSDQLVPVVWIVVVIVVVLAMIYILPVLGTGQNGLWSLGA